VAGEQPARQQGRERQRHAISRRCRELSVARRGGRAGAIDTSMFHGLCIGTVLSELHIAPSEMPKKIIRENGT
jgi:hypothetical protein